jgi:nucleotide-binding universal stress UspA family protein
MPAPTILLAADFSSAGRLALDVASSLAHDAKAKLIVLHVIPGQPTTGMSSVYGCIPEPGIDEVAQRLAAVKPLTSGVACEHRIAAGDPADEIVRLGESERAALIVLGSRRRGKLSELLIGATTATVLRHAKCAVLVCHSPSLDAQ